MITLTEEISKYVMEKYRKVMAQREEILTAFIAKFGTEPQNVVQIERKNHDGSTTWSLKIEENKEAIKALEVEREKLEDTIETLIIVKDNAYSERNKCIAALANFIRDIAQPQFRVYTTHDNNENWENDWRTVLVIERGDLQMTWHFHDSERHLLERLPVNLLHKFDGHDTKEKYNRLIKCFIGGVDI